MLLTRMLGGPGDPTHYHIHKWIKYKKRPGYFRCADSNCNSYREYELVINKETRCNGCDSIFILDWDQARRAKPRCLKCADTKEAKIFRATQDMIKNMTGFNLVEGQETTNE